MIIIRSCMACNERFVVKANGQKFHSEKCAKQYLRTPVELRKNFRSKDVKWYEEELEELGPNALSMLGVVDRAKNIDED